jgi:hypothetical protein
MKIIICGSMSSAQKMIEAEKELVENNHEVILPKNTNKYAEKVLKEKDAHESTKNKIEHDLIRDYFGEIKKKKMGTNYFHLGATVGSLQVWPF